MAIQQSGLGVNLDAARASALAATQSLMRKGDNMPRDEDYETECQKKVVDMMT